MKEILMFVQERCPHCRRAFKWHEALIQKQHPEWAEVSIRVVDEEKEKELADAYDYYYVPTYFVDGVKIQEGPVTQPDVERVFEAAMDE